MTPASLPIDSLAQRCAEETDKFNRRQPSDAQFCFELFRRALAEASSEAFTRIYQVYERQVLNWVYSHSRFDQTGEEAAFFAGSALRTFYFALRGEKFARFPTLQAVLAYLKMCVYTAIAQYIRDQQPAATTPLDDVGEISHTPDLGTRTEAAELWQYICRMLPEERDRLLAHCVFVQDLKPRQIVSAYPSYWTNEREVSVALYRIRRALRNDVELQRRAGLEPEQAAIGQKS